MKLPSERGHLFGRINLVDLLVAVLIIAVAAVTIWKLFGRAASENPLNQSTAITYTVRVNNIDPAVADELSKYVSPADGRRDRLMAAGQQQNGYVVDYRAVPHVNYMSDAAGMSVIGVDSGEGARVDVIFTIEAEISNTLVNEIGTQEIRIGKTHIVKTVNFEFPYGLIIDCVWHEEGGVE